MIGRSVDACGCGQRVASLAGGVLVDERLADVRVGRTDEIVDAAEGRTWSGRLREGAEVRSVCRRRRKPPVKPRWAVGRRDGCESVPTGA